MSSSTEGGGISVAPFLAGKSQQDILGALSAQTAEARKAAAAQKDFGKQAGTAIRRAADEANKLSRAQVARGVAAARGSGIATGGGLAGLSGSTAVNAMREQMAAAAQAEAGAVSAEQAAEKAYFDMREKAALAASEEAVKRGELKSGQQGAGMAFVDEIALIENQYESGQINEEQAAAQIAGKAKFLDPNDPTQRTALKQSFNQLWMMATESPESAPGDAMLEALLSAGIPVEQLFASWTGGTDSANTNAFYNMAMAVYNANRPAGTEELKVGLPGSSGWDVDNGAASKAAIEAALMSIQPQAGA
ncbi:MAG: hypothetical protein Unbinned5179contig1001_48 [Prokaryotic dsDNA virus sp.]|nr:MAG: hypothetical protein Unbinned5179contig1001_48 [Prokaryotic dsDNA virus sp.]|tara:strand:+ start:25265 stop:26182 length:918 start_codon:yes stop_codon:yes gene_type:complete